MKNIFLVMVIIVFIALIFLSVKINSRGDGKSMGKYNKISFDEMEQMTKNLDKYVILDVRTKEEYDEKRIPNSINIADYEIEKVENEILDKDTYIFVYCRSGVRSKGATLKMLEMGYTNVYDVGGIIDYKDNTESSK